MNVALVLQALETACKPLLCNGSAKLRTKLPLNEKTLYWRNSRSRTYNESPPSDKCAAPTI